MLSRATQVKFTQSDLGFNHGWLVQAEGPPGAIFSRFKALLDSDGVSSADISFYFVHWLTDLAGAVPTPLRGCEKFVVAFPRPVLQTLVDSMPIVQRLADSSASDLYEDYLRFAWPSEPLGPTPQGSEAIALMRLLTQVCMACPRVRTAAARPGTHARFLTRARRTPSPSSAR